MQMKTLASFALLLLAITAASAQPSAQNYSWNNLPVIHRPAFRKDTVNIARYGAVPDGITLNTAAINKAITDCSGRC